MIKKLVKFLSIISFIIFLIIFYLSFIGIKTTKFNEKITNKILDNNDDISLSLKEVKFLLDPFNFTANISTNDPTISLSSNELKIKSIKTKVLIKSLIFGKFSIDDLEISTKQIKLKDLILLTRSFKNSAELFLLDKIIKDGFLIAEIHLKFDDKGKIKDNYKINGFIKDARLNFFNKFDLENLNFQFDIDKKKYSLTKIKANFNKIVFSSPLIKVIKKDDIFFTKGKIITEEKNFDKNHLSFFLNDLLKDQNLLEKIRLSSDSNFSFSVNKKFKFKDLSIMSKINLNQLHIKNNFKNLKSYLPDLNEVINLKDHKLIINYDKNKIMIKGNGKVLIKDKYDLINYNITKNDNQYIFDTKINLKNNELLIKFLDYDKKENLESSIFIKGIIKQNKDIRFDLISLIERNNKILFKNLNLNNKLKLISIESIKLKYLNNNNINNQLLLKKENSNYTIEGDTFDATRLINKLMNNDDDSSLFSDFNSKINIKINKAYIDETNFVNNLFGEINFKKNKVNNLDLSANFINNKKISFSIKTNNQQEKITKLFTDHPKPLIKRYDFIEGFEEGYLIYTSIKKNRISNSLLTIDNFKVKEVPVFAKLLSLASLQGIADILTGEGLRFTDFEMKFSNKNKLTTIEEMYAIGPAVSILMDGYIEPKKLISLRGTLVPATTINRSIASIPILGNILIGKKTGEGVFGVSFKIKGPPNDLNTTVNPIKTLTPRFITRTLEKLKKD